MEAQGKFDELNMKRMDLKKWGMIALFGIVALGLIFANLDRIAQFAGWAQPAVQTVVNNGSQTIISGGG